MGQENQNQSGTGGGSGGKFFGLLAAAIVFVLIVGGFFFLGKRDQVAEQSPMSAATEKEVDDETGTYNFGNPKKSAHYESNTPSHAAVLAGVPVNVVIDFNFDLAPPSAISVKTGGKEYGTGETMIDANKLAMRKNLDPDSPDGLYEVAYNACWPDGSCHDGNFRFAIDRTRSENFTDLRGQGEVVVKMKNITFDPKEIIIGPGTKVTWVQEDDVEHFVNTETHPAHTYFPAQNSRGLVLGDTFSVVFDKAGVYPYHCSAHASVMTGTILVEE